MCTYIKMYSFQNTHSWAPKTISFTSLWSQGGERNGYMSGSTLKTMFKRTLNKYHFESSLIHTMERWIFTTNLTAKSKTFIIVMRVAGNLFVNLTRQGFQLCICEIRSRIEWKYVNKIFSDEFSRFQLWAFQKIIYENFKSSCSEIQSWSFQKNFQT